MNTESLLRLSAEDVQPLIGKPQYVVVDVREPYEFEAGHLPESLHIPLHTLPQRINEIPAKRTPIFVCSAGMRSLSACVFAINAGRAQAINLEGGLHAWVDAFGEIADILEKREE